MIFVSNPINELASGIIIIIIIEHFNVKNVGLFIMETKMNFVRNIIRNLKKGKLVMMRIKIRGGGRK